MSAKSGLKELRDREQDLTAKVGQLTIENDCPQKNPNKCLGTIRPISLISKDEQFSIKRQCKLVCANWSSFYYEPLRKSEDELEFEEAVCHELDFWHTKQCYLGDCRLVAELRKEYGISAGRKLAKRLMAEMGIYAIYPKPNLSKPGKQHEVFP